MAPGFATEPFEVRANIKGKCDEMAGMLMNLWPEQESGPKLRTGTAKRALVFFTPYPFRLLLFVVVLSFEAAVNVINPLVYRDIIDRGILAGSTTRVIELALLLCVLGILGTSFGLAQSYLAARVAAAIALRIRGALFRHIQQMPLAFFIHTQTGALASRINDEVSGMKMALTDTLSNAIGSIINFILVLGALFALSWRITLVALLLPILVALPARLWGRRLQAITRKSYDLNASMNSFTVERFSMAGAQLCMLFGRRRDESRMFDERAMRVSDIGVEIELYMRLVLSLLFLITCFATALAYGWGGVIAIKHLIDVGTVVALVALLDRLYAPLMGMSHLQVNLSSLRVSFERVFEILDRPPLIREKVGAAEVPAGAAMISFDHVQFCYPSASEVALAPEVTVQNAVKEFVLHDVTLNICPGQLVALVGASGSGKTTIAQLVARLYDVTSGSVRVNGIDVRDAQLESLQRRIGIVTQDAHFFHATIRENLLYANVDATDAHIWEALRDAQLSDFVASLPHRLDTVIGERGHCLSGGEKQRLAIARLLIKAPEIVILDEATAHLDSNSEAEIQKAFDKVLTGRTSIVIAHRLSTIVNADQIFVLREGRIVERGTHLELLGQSGIYAQLCEKQGEAS